MAKVTLNLKKLSNKEFSRLVINLLRDWQTAKVTLEDPVLAKLKARLTQQSDALHQGLYDVKDRATTKDLKKADTARDQHLQLLADTIKLGRYAETPEEKLAYETLYPLFKNLTKIKQSSYEEESSNINGILDQLKKTDYQAHIKSLNLTKPIQLLTKSQESFDSLVFKHHTGQTIKTVYDNKQTRKELQETYLLLSNYLYIMAKEATPVAYQKLYKIFETNSNLFKPLVGNHKTKDKEEETSPQENKETPPKPKN